MPGSIPCAVKVADDGSRTFNGVGPGDLGSGVVVYASSGYRVTIVVGFLKRYTNSVAEDSGLDG